MAILAMFTSIISTVFVAAQPLPELLSLRWMSSCPLSSADVLASSSSSSLSSLLTWPSLAAPHICTNRLRPNHIHHQSHHRYYRRRCHHPFLFFHLHFSPSNLLFYLTFVILNISLVSSVSFTDKNSHINSGNINSNTVNNYKLRNNTNGHILTYPSKNSLTNEEHGKLLKPIFSFLISSSNIYMMFDSAPQ